MKKLVALLIVALFFVACEKKDEGKGSTSKKASTVTKEVGTYGFTIDITKEVTIEDGLVGGFDIMVGTARLNVSEGSEFTEETLKGALEDAKSNTWDNVTGEEITLGYFMTYDMKGPLGHSFEVRARISKDKKPYDFYGVAKNAKDQKTMVTILKSIK